MSISTFRIEKSGEVFGYDNTLNSILDANNQPVGRASSLLAQAPSFEKSNTPTTIKVLLGHACNYSCSYCVQKDIGNPAERPKNIMTKELIKKMRAHLDLSNVTRIELWGGETLLYWPDIVEIISALDREGITWYIPTNGTILRMKHAEFFRQMKGEMTIGISHDGPGHVSLRGPEFLHRKIDELGALQDAKVRFSFNAVISTTNYDLFAIDDYFRFFLLKADLDHVGLGFELGRTYETGACATESHVITLEQIPHYRSILKAYLKHHLDAFKKGQAPEDIDADTRLFNSLFHFSNGVIPYAKSLVQQSPIRYYSNCGTDDPNLITLDMNGAIRVCQNTDESYIYGNVANIGAAKMQKVDYSKNDFCKDCSVLRLCNRSCPIELPYETFLTNHHIENAHYSEIQLSAFELLFDSPITKVN
ncbi:hypothetical protein [Ralstonia phage RP31]|uniref:Radical SAM core domain-containing protein n=2 Tax=Ripduovirus RP12 TaxID=2560700 RepID=A0A1L7N0R1_9CAUD|nr:radical SAM domain-containing protein [Ralstonia phage RP12]BAW19053.1 hypothetical protein [Ralstonia phage RP12]BAW19338.1 hypothetical protein [Ralstonia phage RP31]